MSPSTLPDTPPPGFQDEQELMEAQILSEARDLLFRLTAITVDFRRYADIELKEGEYIPPIELTTFPIEEINAIYDLIYGLEKVDITLRVTIINKYLTEHAKTLLSLYKFVPDRAQLALTALIWYIMHYSDPHVIGLNENEIEVLRQIMKQGHSEVTFVRQHVTSNASSTEIARIPVDQSKYLNIATLFEEITLSSDDVERDELIQVRLSNPDVKIYRPNFIALLLFLELLGKSMSSDRLFVVIAFSIRHSLAFKALRQEKIAQLGNRTPEEFLSQVLGGKDTDNLSALSET
jgi:hypothetical protein